MHRFYVAQIARHDSVIHIHDRDICQQLNRVLKLRPGELVEFFNDQQRCIVNLDQVTTIQVSGALVEALACQSRSTRAIHLYIANLKGEKMDWVIQKCTELGVASITPIISARTIVRDLSASKKSRYQKIMVEAVEQSGQCVMPQINPPLDLASALAAAPGQITTADSSGEALLSRLKKLDAISLFIGPEGGWTPAELDLFHKKQTTIVSLGATVLRAETAAIVAVALVNT